MPFLRKGFLSKTVDLLSTAEGCTFGFFPTEMGIDLFMLVFPLHSGGGWGTTIPDHIYSYTSQNGPQVCRALCDSALLGLISQCHCRGDKIII